MTERAVFRGFLDVPARGVLAFDPWVRAWSAQMPSGDVSESPKRMNRSHLCQIGAPVAPRVGSWVGIDSASRGPFCFGATTLTGGRESTGNTGRRF